MDRSVNERFVAYLESNKIDEPKIYLKLHILKGKWNNYKSGTRPITILDLISIINEFKNLNARWLLTGEGNMLTETDENNFDFTSPICKNPICQEKINSLEKCNDLLEKHNSFLQQTISEMSKKGVLIQGEPSGGVEAPGKTG